ncbi:Wzz/FepE/Etk N-terminal domain-containing protein [uncultured Paraglaciecola sp.]|uniref:Wzz/FepE/Etk N-terminal domain-containing protein n=1 Tax=uncultured Paraglaciecola sp. TaxID=1765024 RepID=UPI0025DF92F6|nr:Wzz/FepE/Etk N-terminal domain-containing protein [uncultured Paraglaciecola sp.]
MQKTEMPQMQTPAPPINFSKSDEIDLRELWSTIWKGKWLIICITSVFTVSSVFYALSIPDVYKSTAILAPASTSSSSTLSSLAGQFGGFASLAGINLGGSSGGDKTTIAIALIKTWGFLEDFIKNNKIEVEVFAAKGWDRSTRKLLIDQNLYDTKTSTWVRGNVPPSQDGTLVPTSWKLFQKIKNKINISQESKTGLISLSVEHYSPFVAKRWVDLLVLAINEHMQLQGRKEALNSIKYLKTQINNTNIAEMRTIFYQLIEEQTKTLMLAEISSEYVFRTLSSAKIAEVKIKPKRAFIVILGAVLGVMLSMLLVLVHHFIYKPELAR